ncbi:phage antirepressor KilAC domain-containing protein [Oerskovia turbata]
MSDLTPFDFDGQQVRAVVGPDGKPLFVLADICRVLDLGNPSMVAGRLDGDDLSTTEVIDTLGRKQRAHAVTESGVIDVTLDSRKPDARRFRRWLTHDVVPQIMQNGSYGAPQLTGPALMAAALLEAQATLAAKDEQLAIAAPKAEAFDAFLSTSGDLSVNEAAKILSRDHGILTGEKRLRDWMQANGWIYRDSGEPRAYQRRIDQGTLAERARWHHHPETGERVMDTPQVRVTAKGVEALARALTKVVDQGELDVTGGDAA